MGHGSDRFEVGRAGALPPGEEADWLIGPSVARAAGRGPGAIGLVAPIGTGRLARTWVGLLTATGAVLGAPRGAGLATVRTERGVGTAVGTRWGASAGAGAGAGAGAIRRAGLEGAASTTVAGFVAAGAVDLVAGRAVAFAEGGGTAAAAARAAARGAGAFVALGCAIA
jgi:hypothetical protein